MGDGDFPREGCEYVLKVRVLSSSQGPLGLKLGIGLGQGQCDLPPLTTLAGTWNSNVCPGLAVSGTVSATWSWLGCALEEEFGQGLCRARVSGPPSARAAKPTRASAQVSMSPGCLSPSSSSSVPVALASGSARAAARPGVVSCKRLDGPSSHAVVTRGSKCGRGAHVNRTTSIHGVEAPGQNSDTYTALGWSSHDGPRTMGTSGGRMVRPLLPLRPPRSRRPARPDTHWTHTTHIQLTKLEPGLALNRVRARAC